MCALERLQTFPEHHKPHGVRLVPRMILPPAAVLRHFTSLFLAALVLTSFGESRAQSNNSFAAIGEWQSHLSLQEGIDVASCEAFDAYIAGGSVVLQYRDNGEVRRLDKVNALSQANAILVACNPYTEGQLLVAYDDGALDIVEDERVVHYVNAIAETTIFGRRDLRNVAFAAADRAFVCTDFGFLVLDPTEGVFLEDVRTASPVIDAGVLAGDLYLATEDGLEVVPNYLQQPLLRDTSTFVSLNGPLFGKGSEAVQALVAWEDEMYVGYLNDVHAVEPGFGGSRLLDSFTCDEVVDVSGGPDYLMLTLHDVCNPRSDQLLVSTDGTAFQRISTDCSRFAVDEAVQSGTGVAWAGRSDLLGFCRTPALDEPCNCFQIVSPTSNRVYDIDIRDGVVAVAGGSVGGRGEYTFNRSGAYVLRDGNWVNYNERTVTAIRSGGPEALADFVAVALDADTSLYMGAYFEGLVKVETDGEGELFDERNSSLGDTDGDRGRIRIGALDFDAAGNLWVAQFGADSALSVRTSDDTWTSFDVGGCGRDRFLSLEVDPRTGIAWMRDFENGVVAFDANGTFDDPSDDRCKLFGQGQSDDAGLPSAEVQGIHLDRNGVLWAGTSDGIGRLTCTSDPFSQNCGFSRPTAVVDGINGFLFDDQLVRAITSDGGNRKWVGTDNGLFLLDESVSEQLAFFSETNSPLLDNQINTLAFDDQTGKLWIGTAQGLMSLQTESTGGEEFTHGTVEVYPQPVRPDYQGPIAIRGLAQNSTVKITDAAGRLVFETDAIGGQAIWDGNDYTGRRATSGVYLVWASADRSFDRPATVVSKIALLR